MSMQILSARRYQLHRSKLDGAIRLKDPSHTLAHLLSGQDCIYTDSLVLIREAMSSLEPTLLETPVMQVTCKYELKATHLYCMAKLSLSLGNQGSNGALRVTMCTRITDTVGRLIGKRN